MCTRRPRHTRWIHARARLDGAGSHQRRRAAAAPFRHEDAKTDGLLTTHDLAAGQLLQRSDVTSQDSIADRRLVFVPVKDAPPAAAGSESTSRRRRIAGAPVRVAVRTRREGGSIGRRRPGGGRCRQGRRRPSLRRQRLHLTAVILIAPLESEPKAQSRPLSRRWRWLRAIAVSFQSASKTVSAPRVEAA